MAASLKSFDMSREGKDLRIRMAAGDITVSRLSRAFQVEANSLYLKEEFGEMSYWPNDSGRFNVVHLLDGFSLQVMGEDLGSSQIAEQHPGQLSQVFSYGIPQGGPQSNLTRSQLFGGGRRKGGATAKVIHAEMNKNDRGPPNFHEKGQTYVNIKEDTANVSYILSKARDAFSDTSLELVTSNGLKIVDNDGTRGLAFWKCGSRKIYAVRPSKNARESLKRAAKGKAKATFSGFEVSDDSDEDFACLPKRHKGFNEQEIETVNSQISDIKSMVGEILQVNQTMSLPLGIVKLIKDAFICKICRITPMTPPVIATKCCNVLLGCEECVNTWYEGAEGLSKKCPYCNEPRGYANTSQFKGMDEFLVGVKNLLKGEENSPASNP